MFLKLIIMVVRGSAGNTKVYRRELADSLYAFIRLYRVSLGKNARFKIRMVYPSRWTGVLYPQYAPVYFNTNCIVRTESIVCMFSIYIPFLKTQDRER